MFCKKLRHFFGSIMAENLHISFILGKFLLTLHLDITTVNVNILKTYFINLTVNTMSEVASKVTEIIVNKLGVDAAEVTPNASFTNDLGADSLDTVDLIMEFENQFGIQIPDDDAQKISTVGDAIKYIEERL